MRNQKGESEFEFLIGGVIVICALVLAFKGCTSHQVTTTKLINKTTVHLSKLKPNCTGSVCQGSYSYQAQNGSYWYYRFNYVMPGDTSTDSGSYRSLGSSLPPSGRWVNSKGGPEKDSIEEESDQELTENVEGEPLTDEQTAEAAGAEAAAAEVAQTSISTQPEESHESTSESNAESSASSESSSGSSDSGSSGGDSGDGGGGGGGD